MRAVASCVLEEVSVTKIRIKFRKYGVMKFIGHLDMMRYFQKAMRRAEIDIRYSEGFSPHQIMSFAAPLGVGITSDGEYLDIEAETSRSSQASVDALNQVMVEGVEVVSYQKLPEHAKTAMSIVAAADYKLFYKDGYDAPASCKAFEDGLRQFFIEPRTVMITKQTKKSEKTIDLKQLVYDWHIQQDGGKPLFYMKLSAGSVDNVKPELVLGALYQSMGLTYDANAIQVHRCEVYTKTEQGFLALSETGEPIM